MNVRGREPSILRRVAVIESSDGAARKQHEKMPGNNPKLTDLVAAM